MRSSAPGIVKLALGVRLLERSSRHVALTATGETLLHHGRHALNAVGAAAEKTRRAGDQPDHLRLVIKPGGDANLLSGILAAYAGRPDARQVDRTSCSAEPPTAPTTSATAAPMSPCSTRRSTT